MKSLFLFALSSILCSCSINKISHKEGYLDKFKYFALNCSPIYHTQTDTFGVAAIPMPDEKINKYLSNLSKESSEYKEIKDYAFLIMMKVYYERLRKSPTVYWLLNEHNRYENYIEVICLDESKLKKNDPNRDTNIVYLNDFYSYLKSKNNVELKELEDILKNIYVLSEGK